MTGVSGTMFGSKSPTRHSLRLCRYGDGATMVYNDDNRLTSSTYGGVTDLYYYTYTGLRYRARLGGTYYRYLYHGERVLEELNDSGTMQARYTTEDGSYYGQWLHLYRTSGTLSRFPMYDNIGTARGLVDASGTVTDTYELDTFGRSVSSSGTTPNPYRYGGAWGYITDPSGMLQLGARYYWPEIGRFISQDPIGSGVNWYIYAEDNPLVWIDPEGTDVNWGRGYRVAKCVAMEMYGNDAIALVNWVGSQVSGGRPGPRKGSPSKLVVGTIGPRAVQWALPKGSKLTHAKGARWRGLQVAYHSLEQKGNIDFVGNQTTKGMSRVALKWTKWGRRLGGAAKVLGRASGYATAGFAVYYGVKCYRQTK